MGKNIVVTGITPKGYGRLIEANIRGEQNPIGKELWQQAALALVTGNVQVASDLMEQAKASSSLYFPHPDGGYGVH